MVVLDSVVEFNFKSVKKEAHVAPVAAEIELQSASQAGPTASSSYSVAIAPSVEATNKNSVRCTDVQLQQLSYLTLLRQTDVFTNLAGEAIHNLTDGIAIATAFTLSWETGILVPHHFTLERL
jgi:zinc transporter ZupT